MRRRWSTVGLCLSLHRTSRVTYSLYLQPYAHSELSHQTHVHMQEAAKRLDCLITVPHSLRPRIKMNNAGRAAGLTVSNLASVINNSSLTAGGQQFVLTLHTAQPYRHRLRDSQLVVLVLYHRANYVNAVGFTKCCWLGYGMSASIRYRDVRTGFLSRPPRCHRSNRTFLILPRHRRQNNWGVCAFDASSQVQVRPCCTAGSGKYWHLGTVVQEVQGRYQDEPIFIICQEAIQLQCRTCNMNPASEEPRDWERV